MKKNNFSIQNHGFALFYCRFLMILMSKFTKRYVYNGLASKITNFTNFTSFTNFTNFWKLFWRIHAELHISWSAHELTWGGPDNSLWAELLTESLELSYSIELMSWTELLTWAHELTSRSGPPHGSVWGALELTRGTPNNSSWAELLTWAHELTSWSGAPHGSARRVFKNL